MFKCLWQWFTTPSYDTLKFRKMLDSMAEQEKQGWVFEVGPRGGLRKYYNPDKDQTPNKDGWNRAKHNKNHPFYKPEE